MIPSARCRCCLAFVFALSSVLVITEEASAQRNPLRPPGRPLAAPGTPADVPPSISGVPAAPPKARELVAAGVVTTPFLPTSGKKEQRILAALADETEVNFVETPLIDAAQFLSELTNIPIIVDQAALDEEGIPVDEPIHLKLAGVSLRSALTLMFDDLGMTWVVEDEVLKLTTKTKANLKQLTRVYPVADLIDPLNEDSVKELVTAIQSSLPDASWEDVDGSGGTVSPVSFTKSLVVRQTRKTHEDIVTLLDSLREAQKLAQVMEKRRPAPGEVRGSIRPGTERFANEELDLSLPLSEALTIEPDQQGQLVVDLSLDKAGQPQVRFDNRTEPLAKAVKRLEKVKARSVIVRAEGNVKHLSLATAMSALQKAGVNQISVAVKNDRGGDISEEAATKGNEAVNTGIPIPGIIAP